MPLPDSLSFRRLMGCFTTGVAVATVAGSNGPIGLTVNSLTSVSLLPPLALFCLDRAAHVFPAFEAAKHYAINILAAGQEDISRSFADFRHYPQPPGIWDEAPRAAPVLRGTLGWMICRKAATHDGGDHTILVGEVAEVSEPAPDAEPLVYFRGKYHRLGS